MATNLFINLDSTNDPIPWADIQIEWDASNNTKFIGKNKEIGASSNASSWYIWKTEFDGSGNLTRRTGPKIGAWNDRATLL